jgi:DNA-binding MarR family transcriptional regulator
VSELFELALSVKALTRELERLANEAMRPLGLTGAQADALIVIDQAGPLALKALGGLLIAESGHPSRLVDRLVEAGLITRRESAKDRRLVELSSTAAGRRLARRARAARLIVLQQGAALMGDHAVGPSLALLRDILRGSSYEELIRLRCELFEAEDRGRTTPA